MTYDDMDEMDKKAIDCYIIHDDIGFENFTEGPRHRRALEGKLLNKKSTGLIREELIARFLGLKHNTRMHSTTDGVTTFDAVDTITDDCYEIKAEEHTTDNPDRKTQSGQLSGTGVFSSIRTQEHIDKLSNDNPMIAHGMFGDGRLLCLVRFRLMDSKAIDRITKYALGATTTEPRYSFADWINCPTLDIVYVSDNWPKHINPKYRKIMQDRWKRKHLLIQSNTSSPILDLLQVPKTVTIQQTSTLYTEDSDPQQNLDFVDTQSTSLSD